MDQPIANAMTHEVQVVKQTDQIEHAAKLMKDKQISRLLVLDQSEEAVGMLSLRDVTEFIENERFKAELVSAIKH